jgi:hypothetical protein
MSKFNIDYSQLSGSIYKTSYKLSEIKDKIEKVAFDIVRFKDSDKGADLWQIQSADDGEYIVALYNPSEDEVVKTASTKSDWEVLHSKSSNSLNIFYKGDQIAKLASGKLGLPESSLEHAESYLPKSLAENKKLVAALLNQLPEATKNVVLNKYPKLK